MKRVYALLLFIVFTLACTPSKKTISSHRVMQANIAANGKLFASLFMQRAAEYQALCRQAYNIAERQLDKMVLLSASSKPKAVITDLDETALDNSAQEVYQDLQGKGFDPIEWTKWTAMGAADTIPGALSFFKYAASKKVEVFYVSNRDEKDREGTLKNLQRYGFPNADNEHLLLRQNTSGKENRRQQVMTEHNVILLLGDNLSDFSDLFDKKSTEERKQTVEQLSALFGSRYIILPNSVYGDWENAIYQYRPLTTAQKDSVIKSSVKGY